MQCMSCSASDAATGVAGTPTILCFAPNAARITQTAPSTETHVCAVRNRPKSWAGVRSVVGFRGKPSTGGEFADTSPCCNRSITPAPVKNMWIESQVDASTARFCQLRHVSTGLVSHLGTSMRSEPRPNADLQLVCVLQIALVHHPKHLRISAWPPSPLLPPTGSICSTI